MALYHPPKIITNNAAPVLSADLAYEVNGKCGCETIILGDMDGGVQLWDASNPVVNGVPNCTDYSHVYKMVALENTMFRTVSADNLSTSSQNILETGFSLKIGSEILADFTVIEISRGMVILYRDCSQS
tara:strand:+ start:255 stop:641 length:387 start_codon:yes stop_codon:yes gene_type:complete